MTKVSKLKHGADSAGIRRFSRHASFDQICQVAEKERSKLYGCCSEPSSPVKKLVFDESLEGSLPRAELKKSQSIPVMVKTSQPTPAMVKKPYLLVQDVRLAIIQDATGKSSIMTSPNQQTSSLGNSSTTASSVFLRTKSVATSDNMKQPTVIPLTRDQIDAVLRSLKVPVPNNKEANHVDASTQSSPETPVTRRSSQTTILEQRLSSPDCTLAALNETTPHAPPDRRGVKRTYVTVKSLNPADKKRCMSIPTPPSTEEESGASSSDSFSLTPDGEVTTITRCGKRKATVDRRALHLAPEFRNSPPPSNAPRRPTPDVLRKITASELELAAPLADDDESPYGKLSPLNQGRVPQTVFSSMQSVTIQLPNQQPMSVFQFNGQNRVAKMSPHSPPMQAFPHPQSLQVVSGMPVTPGVTPVSFMMPVAFSPPLTPSSPTVFTLPTTTQHAQQNMAFTSVHLIQPPSLKGNPSPIQSSLVPPPVQTFPCPTEPVRMIIPSEQPISSMESFQQAKANALFAPIRVANDPKSAIRKLSLSELC